MLNLTVTPSPTLLDKALGPLIEPTRFPFQDVIDRLSIINFFVFAPAMYFLERVNKIPKEQALANASEFTVVLLFVGMATYGLHYASKYFDRE